MYNKSWGWAISSLFDWFIIKLHYLFAFFLLSFPQHSKYYLYSWWQGYLSSSKLHVQLRRVSLLVSIREEKLFSASSRLPVSFYWLGLGHRPFSKLVIGKEIGRFWFRFGIICIQPLTTRTPPSLEQKISVGEEVGGCKAVKFSQRLLFELI